MTPRLFLLAALLSGAVVTLARSSADDAPNDAPMTPSAIYDKTLRSTCWVRLPKSFGSGSLVDKERKWVLTNAHVVQNSKTVTVWFPVFDDKGKPIVERAAFEKACKPVRGEVIRKESSKDLALVKLDSIPAGATEIKLAEKSPKPGDRVHSVGNGKANGCLFAYHAGFVRQLARNNDTYSGVTIVNCRVLETQSPHNPGDSGGPTVNDRGEQVGVTSSYVIPAQLMSFHIDVAEVHDLLKKARHEENAEREAAEKRKKDEPKGETPEKKMDKERDNTE